MARRLAAILAADVAGYSRLMHADEETTHASFNTAMATYVVPSVRRHQGRIVKNTGDGFLAEFSSAVEAVRSALEFQEALLHEAGPLPPEQRLLFRVGIDVGDVIVEKHDIFGDHVNIAARLEQLAQPGGILISGNAYGYVHDRVACRFNDTGERQVKNIARPVRIVEVSLPGWNMRQLAPASEPPATDRSRVLKLHLFGVVSLRTGGQDIPLKSLKSRAMLGYVALNQSFRETRERLVGLLWSESSEAQARAVLRQVVRDLRGRLMEAGCAGLNFGPYEIGFDPGAIDVDVLEVLSAAESGEAHPLLLERQHLAEELLAGLEDIDPAFRVWLIAKRNTLRDQLLRALEAAIVTKPAGSREESTLATALLNLDQTHEDACRRLMRARASAGDMAGALRVYKTLWDLLDEEYDMEPSAATQALVAEIKGGTSAPGSSPAEAVGAKTALKVASRLAISLQAATMHEVDAEKLHLVTGFRQHLIASLVRFREWQVTDVPFSAAAMGVSEDAAGRYELQMNVHQNGPALHLLFMLKQTETNLYIWSDGFELKLERWFESQRRVVQRIAMALNVHLSAEQLRRLSEQPDVSLGIYDRWLRCQTLIRTFNLQHWQRAASQFLEIIEAAPNFVPAYCGLADMHNAEHIVYPGKVRTREHEQQALHLARQAVELDPSNSNAHRSLAWANAMANQHIQAVMHIETAYELNPNDPWTHFSAALLFAFCGQTERSTDLVSIARDMAVVPSKMHWAYLVDIHFLRGDYEAALEASEQALDFHRTVRAWRAAALAQLGRTSEAANESAMFLNSVRANWFGAKPATDSEILRWLLHLYPISERGDWERLRGGLDSAGLPVTDIEYRSW
jgi:class 3 adenylate cyclase/DNA-binding SARP family transcriptional activator